MIKEINLDDYIEIFKISFDKDTPNQEFDVYINDLDFTIRLNTYINQQSRVSVFFENQIIINEAPINLYNIALNSLNKVDIGGDFFFLSNENFYSIDDGSYENLENKIFLFFGVKA